MFRFVVVFIVFFLFIASSTRAGDNLVINGSFEIADASGPYGWKIQRSGDTRILLEEDAYVGGRALTIETHKTEDEPTEYLSKEVGTIIQNIPITPKSRYLLSFWYRFDHKSEDTLIFYIFGKPNYLGSFTKWTRAMKVFESGSGKNLDLMIKLYRRTSKVWIDNVKLIKLRPNAIYLSNPNFDEVGKDGKPVGWAIDIVGSPTIKVENTSIYGDRCLSIEGHATPNASENYPTSDAATVYQSVPLKPNKSYNLSFWYRTTKLSAPFKVILFEKQHYLPDSFEWVRKTINVNSESHDKTAVKFSLYRRIGKVWVNDVELVEAP
ncbi:MAG: hypothetical protein ACE5H1_08065 [Thermodesulfobacteriota bacterium]